MSLPSATLVVVDCQNDFSRPDGALYVPGGEVAVSAIRQLLQSGKIARTIFTLDWHPLDHCSFKPNGGIWPPHCVAYSPGAALDNALFVDNLSALRPHFVTKGRDASSEEYGAFAQPSASERSLLQSENLVVCGLAGDYCVLETLRNIRRINPSARVFLPGIASIDGGEALQAYLQSEGVATFL